MKNLIIAIAIMLFAFNASAQYNRFEASFVAANMKFDDYGESITQNPKGAELGFIHGFGLSKNIPLFLEVGGRLQFLHLNLDDWEEDLDITDNFLNLSVPVVATYKFNVTDNISIAPQFGFNLKFNLVAKEKEEYKGESESYSWFDGDDAAKRFQFGLNAGVGFSFSKFYLGYRFQPDLSEFIKDVKTNANVISVGITF